MGLIKEPKDIDFTIKSEPWSEEELADFRKLMEELKARKNRKNLSFKKTVKKKQLA